MKAILVPPTTYLQWHLGVAKLRLTTGKMHRLTIAFGLVVCMAAGAMTVVQETLPERKSETYRLFRTARKAGRRAKNYLTDLWN